MPARRIRRTGPKKPCVICVPMSLSFSFLKNREKVLKETLKITKCISYSLKVTDNERHAFDWDIRKLLKTGY